ncbi:MAG: hypothetical protein PHS35_03345 [Dehalococcoidales bacterium]|jgi:hypothetical protein|nr:hypothetical protein [Dehalococcoidales bacterium]
MRIAVLVYATCSGIVKAKAKRSQRALGDGGRIKVPILLLDRYRSGTGIDGEIVTNDVIIRYPCRLISVPFPPVAFYV